MKTNISNIDLIFKIAETKTGEHSKSIRKEMMELFDVLLDIESVPIDFLMV